MNSPLLYLQYHSTRNRLRTRIKRLQQPKYLAGAIVGGIYIYFYLFRYLFMAGPRPGPAGVTPETLALLESLGALALLVIVLMAWIIPHDRAALTFTEAEIAFLFPAPLSRRGLIHFKLLRSQIRIFVTTFFLTLIFNRLGGHSWMHAIGWWLALSTLNLHLLGSSFARTMLLERGVSNWQRRLLVLALVVVAAGAVVLWAGRTLPRLDFAEGADLETLRSYAEKVLVSGPLPYLLYPFRLMVRPYFSPGAASFFYALGPALLLMALHYFWVIRSNVAFEEASIEASQKLAVRIAAARAGNWRGSRGVKIRKKRAPFKLKPVGFSAVALLWKNLISAGQIFSARFWILLAVIAGSAFTFTATTSSDGIMTFLGMLSAIFLGWSVLIGPQFLRQDLRQDLAHADILKSFPLPGWQIVLGELLAPAVMLTGIQWLLLIFASDVLHHIPAMTAGLGTVIVLSVAIVLPALNAVMLLIPNAGVLLFPAWFQPGKEGPQGVEAMGQRMIMMLGQLLAFTVALVPAAILFTVVFLIINIFAGPVAAVAPAAGVAAMVLAAEAWLGVRMLGQVFERFDLSAELAA